MYIVKNALVSIWRNKGRNILIGIIIAVISAACAITLAIRSSADKIVKSYEEKYPVEATIGMDREALTKSLREGDKSQEEMIEAFNKIEALNIEEVEKYGDSDFVESFSYTYTTSMNGKSIKEATDSLVKEKTTTETETTTKKKTTTKKSGSSNSSSRPNFPGGMPPGGFDNGGSTSSSTTTTTTTRKKTTTSIEKIMNEKASKGTFSIVGYSSYDAMSDFIKGNYTITDGEVSSDFDSKTCVISEELATLNDLKVGDKITFVSAYDTSVTYELEITGIYKENTDSSSDMRSMYSSSANTIITNVTTVKDILSKDTKSTGTVTPTYILKSSELVEAFKEEVKEKGLSEYYTVEDNSDVVENATKTIVNVKEFATTFLIITLIIGAVVLLVINMINIRERKYEIGVLRTIGMKKSIVGIQFLVELLVVCIVGLMIGATGGALSSVKVSNQLLSTEIKNAESDYDEINKNFGGSMQPPENMGSRNRMGINNIEQVESMDAVVDLKVLGELLAIGVGLTLVGSIASLIAISRFSPLDILKERS